MNDLLQRSQQRADLEGDTSIANDEWFRLISEAYGELYTIVLESGMEYFEYAAQFTTTGTNTVSEFADHLSTVGVFYLENGHYHMLRELMAQERARWTISNSTGSRATAFSLVDDTLYLYPTPPAGQTYEMRYVPQPPELSTFAGTDVVDVVLPDGLTFLIWAVTVKARAKAQSDVTFALAEREAARDRFTKTCGLRALNNPRRPITDIETDYVGWSDW